MTTKHLLPPNAQRCAARGALILALAAGCSAGGRSPDHADPGARGEDHHGDAGSSSAEPRATGSGAALVPLRSCADVERAVRSAAVRAMNQLLDAQLAWALSRVDEEQCWFGLGPQADALPNANSAAAPVPNDSPVPSDVSDIDDRASDVDEPDLVKSDGRYLFLVTSGSLHIIDASPAAQAKQVAGVWLEHTPTGLLLHGDRLLVFSAVSHASHAIWPPRSAECVYGDDCAFTGDGRGMRITVFDVSDRAAPVRLRTIETRATYVSARRIGGAVHMALYEEPKLFETLRILPEPLEQPKGLCTGSAPLAGQSPLGAQEPAPGPGDRARVEQLFAALRGSNVAAIEAAPFDQLLSKVDDEERADETCSGFYESPLADGTAVLTLASFDIANHEQLQTSSIVSRPGAIYASGDAYYISVRQQRRAGQRWFQDLDDAEHASLVHKFALAGMGNRYVASGVVTGRLVNAFSLDEYADHLRVATTSGRLPGPDVHSTISVLAQRGAELALVGQVDQIAKHADIRSARFVGERGYLVPFEETEPLSVVDLARPQAPELLGELEVPGFSTYMHVLDDGHLLTIDYGDAVGADGVPWFNGVTLRIFDVTSPPEAQLAQEVVIGTRGVSAGAATNPLAFDYVASRQMLTAPITLCESGPFSSGIMTFNGLQLYRVDVDDGFALQGSVSHPYVEWGSESSPQVGAGCPDHWTQANSVVKRAVFLGDSVYSISDVLVRVSDLRDLSGDPATIGLSVH